MKKLFQLSFIQMIFLSIYMLVQIVVKKKKERFL